MKLKESIQRHPLTSYFVLAYGLPWTSILTLLASKKVSSKGGLTE
jgi:hypothetical protein